MWSPNELLKIEKQRDILSYITLQFFHFKKVPLEHCPLAPGFFRLNKQAQNTERCKYHHHNEFRSTTTPKISNTTPGIKKRTPPSTGFCG